MGGYNLKQKFLSILLCILVSTSLPSITVSFDEIKTNSRNQTGVNAKLELNSGTRVLNYILRNLFEGESFVTDGFWNLEIHRSLHASLLNREQHGDNYVWVPDLAVSMPTTLDENNSFSLELKQDLFFSSGSPITTEDVIFSYDAAANVLGHSLGELLIDGGITATDNTLFFNFKTYVQFPNLIAHIPIIEKLVYEEASQACQAAATDASYNLYCRWKGAEFNQGAGPFRWVEWQDESPNDVIFPNLIVEKNPYYWNVENVLIDEIRFNYIKEDFRAGFLVNYLANQNIDIIAPASDVIIENFADIPQSNNFPAKSLFVQTLMLNHDHPIFGTGTQTPLGESDVSQASIAAREVRIALAHLFNRTQIIQDIYGGTARSVASMVPPASNGYNPVLAPFPFNIETAKSHMELAGYDYSKLNDTDSDGRYEDYFFEFKVSIPGSSPLRLEYAENFYNELDKIGIGVDVVTVPQPSAILRYNDSMTRVPLFDGGGYDLIFIGINWDIDWDPIGLYKSNEIPPDGSNWQNYNNSAFDNLIDAYVFESDLTLKYATLGEIQEQWKTEVVDIAIISPDQYIPVGCQIKGLDSDLFINGYPRMDKLYFDYNTCPFNDPLSVDSQTEPNLMLYTGIVLGGLIIGIITYYFATKRIKKIRPTKEEKKEEASRYLDEAKKYREDS